MNSRTPAPKDGTQQDRSAPPQVAAGGAPADVWHTLQQSIGNAAIGRMRRVQHQALSEEATPVDAATRGQIEASRDNGKPLSSSVQQQMAPHFGSDVANVRVHDDVEAGSMAKDLHARAFAQGRDVYFAPGQYDPASQAGRDVLTHELTHVSRGVENVGVVHCVGEDIPTPYGSTGSAREDEGPQQSVADPGGGASRPAEYGASEGEAFREMVGGEEYTGTTNVEWELGGNSMVVTVPINFVGQPPAARWFPEIRRTWNVFDLVNTATGERVNLEFVPQTDSAGYTVTVVSTSGRANENTWFLGDTRTTTAPHEFGHMLGLQDEYQITREHYRGIVGRAAPHGDRGEGGADPAAVASELHDQITAQSPNREAIHGVITDNGIEQGDFAQRIMERYDADYGGEGTLIRSLTRLRATDPDFHIFNTIEAFSYTSGSIMGSAGQGDAIDHDHGVEARHIRRFAQIVQTAYGGHWRPEARA